MSLRPCPIAVAVLAAATLAAPARAQQGGGDEGAVLAVVQRLFQGMRRADAALVRSTFVEGARLIGTADREGDPAVRFLPADSFAAAAGNATQEWDEQFWDPVVQIRDHLATVWGKYAFYLDGEFHHCGVDAFTLARTADGWKIVSIADTRQTEGCELPPGRE